MTDSQVGTRLDFRTVGGSGEEAAIFTWGSGGVSMTLYRDDPVSSLDSALCIYSPGWPWRDTQVSQQVMISSLLQQFQELMTSLKSPSLLTNSQNSEHRGELRD